MIFIASMGIILAITFAYIMVHQQKQIIRNEQKLKELQKAAEKYQNEQSVLVSADLRFAKELAEINRQLVSMDNHLQSLENKRNNDGGYQHALKILEMGGNKDEIISSCHLSNAEAELLMNLHAYRAVIKSSSTVT